MAAPRGPLSLRAFLAAARDALSAPPAQRSRPLTFVVGNESADLDSLCSALVLAYLRTHTPPRRSLHIPLANLPREDLALRPELSAVLRHADLQPSDLLTLSDLPPEAHLPADAARWLLVDHNALTGELARRFGSADGALVGCIDHHDDEKRVPQDCGPDRPRLIRKCGSCMSLVLEYCRQVWDELALSSASTHGAATDQQASAGQPEDEADSTNTADWDAQLARVALGPILVDTTNLTSKDKVTPADEAAIELAEAHLRRGADAGVAAAAHFDRTAMFEEIMRLKEDVSHLSYRDNLRRDYKSWIEAGLHLGMATLSQGFVHMLEQGDEPQFVQAMRDWAEEQKLDVLAVMTVSRPGGNFTRELLVWGLNEKGAKVAKLFAEKNKNDLGLSPWADGQLDDAETGDQWRMCWKQAGLLYSRKQVSPMIREAMKGAVV